MNFTNSKPLFICGFPRSGTTAMSEAIQIIDRYTTTDRKLEGHFTYFFTDIIKKINSGKFNKASIIDDKEYYKIFKSKLSIFLGDFWENISNADSSDYWIEKTPGIRQIRSIKEYSELFPNAKFIFIYRDPLSCVYSNINMWSLNPNRLNEIAENWSETMKAWRDNKEYLNNNYVEIYQNNLRNNLNSEINKLSKYLGLSMNEEEKLMSFFGENEVNTSKDKQMKFTENQEKDILKIVTNELQNWGEITKLYTQK